MFEYVLSLASGIAVGLALGLTPYQWTGGGLVFIGFSCMAAALLSVRPSACVAGIAIVNLSFSLVHFCIITNVAGFTAFYILLVYFCIVAKKKVMSKNDNRI